MILSSLAALVLAAASTVSPVSTVSRVSAGHIANSWTPA